MILPGGDERDLRVFHFFGNLLDVDARRADFSDAPHVHLAIFGQAHGEAGIAVDHFDVVLQFARHAHKAQRGRQVLLGGFGEGVVILRHEMRRDEHDAEHDQHHEHGKHSEPALHKPVEDLAAGADDQFGIVRHAILELDFLFALAFFLPEPLFLIF